MRNFSFEFLFREVCTGKSNGSGDHLGPRSNQPQANLFLSGTYIWTFLLINSSICISRMEYRSGTFTNENFAIILLYR